MMQNHDNKMISIAGHRPVLDPNYRYKMSAIYGETKGKTTILPNLSQVATELHRDPGEILRFFCCELGTQTKAGGAKNRETAATISGRHSNVVFQTLTTRCIEIFVLCPQCGLPETKYKVRSNSVLHQWAACGARARVEEEHKGCKYIIVQHKKKKASDSGTNKNDRRNKKGRKNLTKKEGVFGKVGIKAPLVNEVKLGKKEEPNSASSDDTDSEEFTNFEAFGTAEDVDDDEIALLKLHMLDSRMGKFHHHLSQNTYH